jgi:hypothetical protein
VVNNSIAASIMPASARAVRSAWVSDWSVFLVAGKGWGMFGNKLVSDKQVYQLRRTCQFKDFLGSTYGVPC